MPKKDPIYFFVEEGIPMPPRSYVMPKINPLPFAEMRVGDSFLLPPGTDINSVKRRMFKFIKKIEAISGVTISFGERKQADGARRIWRVK